MKNKLRRLFRKIGRYNIFRLEKRERFIIVTGILTLGMMFASSMEAEMRIWSVLILAILTYPLTYWGLKEDIKGVERITLFILPISYILAISLFYFLLPVRWLTRLPTVILFAIGMYAIQLCLNIYNVAANRSIQLLRAAQSVGFLLTLVVMFLATNIILSFRLPFFINFLGMLILSTILFFQFFWSTTLEEKQSGMLVILSLGCGLLLGEFALALSFWPVRTTISALFLTSVFYTIGGWMREALLERLFESVIREYVWIPIVVFILMFFVTQWG
ncbi:hypothetical protein HYW54_05370 [Candidatus Gottesmanbacteria bacterium]|nr:hypothetical protein [Candidatus Gottesmanbacteria bacterium]